MKPDRKIWRWLCVSWLARLVLAGVFLWAALPKIANPHDFALAIYHYQLLPDRLINPLAIFLPWLELLVAIGLCWSRWRLICTVLTTAMLCIFLGAQFSALARGLDINCGCFGSTSLDGNIDLWSLLFKVVLLIIAVLATVSTWRMQSLGSRKSVSG